MSKKDFIALADAIRAYQASGTKLPSQFSTDQLNLLAHFCYMQNPRFDKSRWLAYIAGECGSSGGRLKTAKAGLGTVTGEGGTRG